MSKFEKWVEDNFDRQSLSMEGSCETVEYVPRFSPTPPYAATPARFISRRLLVTLATMCMFGASVLVGSLTA